MWQVICFLGFMLLLTGLSLVNKKYFFKRCSCGGWFKKFTPQGIHPAFKAGRCTRCDEIYDPEKLIRIGGL